MSSAFFVFRHTLIAFLATLLPVLMWKGLIGRGPDWLFFLLCVSIPLWALVDAFSHVRRVRLITDHPDSPSLANRHRRQVELPFGANEAFDLVEAAIRELPNVDLVEATRDSLQIRARVRRVDPYSSGSKGPKDATGMWGNKQRNQVFAIVKPGEGTSTLRLMCEPEGGAWLDFFFVDDGTNLENAEAITRALAHRVAEARKGEAAVVRETATDKELAVAKLSLLHAQVEPHFLYNTLASAQVLTRTDPARADEMLGNLITYLRNSLPRPEDSMSTVGGELVRAQAYLEILRIRMGERLGLQIQVPEALKRVPMPPMMLQTLVENSIKHGLEPVTGGGNIWIIARESDGKVAVTVADDGMGFSEGTGGTGIGLKNIRERLRLAYGGDAAFTIVANFPRGVAATITLPVAGPAGGAHA